MKILNTLHEISEIEGKCIFIMNEDIVCPRKFTSFVKRYFKELLEQYYALLS